MNMRTTTAMTTTPGLLRQRVSQNRDCRLWIVPAVLLLPSARPWAAGAVKAGLGLAARSSSFFQKPQTCEYHFLFSICCSRLHDLSAPNCVRGQSYLVVYYKQFDPDVKFLIAGCSFLSEDCPTYTETPCLTGTRIQQSQSAGDVAKTASSCTAQKGDSPKATAGTAPAMTSCAEEFHNLYILFYLLSDCYYYCSDDASRADHHRETANNICGNPYLNQMQKTAEESSARMREELTCATGCCEDNGKGKPTCVAADTAPASNVRQTPQSHSPDATSVEPTQKNRDQYNDMRIKLYIWDKRLISYLNSNRPKTSWRRA